MAVTTPTRSPLPAALAGAHVLIIGGGSGIGAAAATLLADVGATVTAASRGGLAPDARVAGLTLDLDDEAALRDAVGSLEHVDHVFVTAASFTAGPVAVVSDALAASVAISRLQGALEVARAVAGRLPQGGSLTFTSAIGAVRPAAGLSAASASAAGVEGIARALAVELAPVRVNVVRPGATDTPMLRGFLPEPTDEHVAAYGAGLPLGRVARAAEVAAAALFLMANPYVTGSVVTVDGGASLA